MSLPPVAGHTVTHQHDEGDPCVLGIAGCRYHATLLGRLRAWWKASLPAPTPEPARLPSGDWSAYRGWRNGLTVVVDNPPVRPAVSTDRPVVPEGVLEVGREQVWGVGEGIPSSRLHDIADAVSKGVYRHVEGHAVAVQMLYDLVLAVCAGSGFLDAHEYAAVEALAQARGFADVEQLKPR